MARDDRRPSGWLFWGLPLAANLCLVPFILMLRARWYPGMRGIRGALAEWVDLPAGLFQSNVVYPIGAALRMGRGAAAWAALFVGLWELSALSIGLVVYGGAWLIYAIIPEPGREGSHGPPVGGEDRSDG